MAESSRVRGGRKPMVGFRAPPDVEEYLEAAENQTDVMVTAVRLLRDLREELGPDYWEVERRAKVEAVGVGTILGRLVLEKLRG